MSGNPVYQDLGHNFRIADYLAAERGPTPFEVRVELTEKFSEACLNEVFGKKDLVSEARCRIVGNLKGSKVLHKPAVFAVVTFTALLIASAAFNSLLPLLLGLLVLLRWIRFDPEGVLNIALLLLTQRFTIARDKMPRWLLTFVQTIASLTFFGLVYLVLTLLFETRLKDFQVVNFLVKAAGSVAISYCSLRAGASDPLQVWFTRLRQRLKL